MQRQRGKCITITLGFQINEDTCELLQAIFLNSHVVKNFEITSNKIGYVIKYGLGLSLRRLRLVRWVFALAFGRNQSIKLMEGSEVLFFIGNVEHSNRRSIYDLEFKGYVTLLFKSW